ncbi:hypothetical protein OOZ51_21075 [Arthrobacter sp. MI7-26]|nr:hypothetical protein [Arthrobacter sp. MI7-26]
MRTARIIGTVPAAPMGLKTMADGKKKMQKATVRTMKGTFPARALSEEASKVPSEPMAGF